MHCTSLRMAYHQAKIESWEPLNMSGDHSATVDLVRVVMWTCMFLGRAHLGYNSVI
jgi:hypothetical protein